MMLSIDGSAGVSGDRLLAALVDAGWPVSRLRRVLARLPVPPSVVRLHRRREGTAIELRWPRRDQRPPRPAHEILQALRRCAVPATLRRRAVAVLTRLIQAEAAVHRCLPGRVLLYQLSEPDTLADLVGFSAGLAFFRIRWVVASPLLVGARHRDHDGRWRSVPGPAVRRLTTGWPVWWSRQAVEYTTPTGAAIVTALARPAASGAASRVLARGPYRRSVPRRVLAVGRGMPWPPRAGLGPVTLTVLQ